MARRSNVMGHLRNAVREMEMFTEGSEHFKVAVVLLLGLRTRHHLNDFRRRTGYDRADLQKWFKRLRDNGIWVGDKTLVDWETSCGFLLDVMVGTGELSREPENMTQRKQNAPKES